MLGEIVGSLITGAAGWFGQQETNKMQAQMQQQQMQFQERMSNTAYQRASADMQAAGLNPMMMFGSGGAASSPQGTGATPLVKSGLDADAVQKAIASAAQAELVDAQVKKLEAETITELRRPAQVEALTATEKFRPSSVIAGTDLSREKAITERNIQDRYRESLPIVKDDALSAENRSAMNATARRLLDQGALAGKAASSTLRPVLDLVHSAAKSKRVWGD